MEEIRNVNELLACVDEMEIYEKDYDTLLSLIKNADDKFFTKAIEEIINGEVEIVDFEKVLPEKSYREIMELNLPKQEKMRRDMEKISEMRGNEFLRKNNIGIARFFAGNDDTEKIEFYEREEKIFRDKILYSMISARPDDSGEEIALKSRIADAVTNFYFVQKRAEIDPTITDKIKNGKILFALNGTEDHPGAILEFPILDPAEVLISQTDLIIPIEFQSQVLDASDQEFIRSNNISEEQMKKIKSLAEFMRQDLYIKEENNG